MRCLDRRVLIGLAAVGVAVFVLQPAWLGAVIPILVVLVCPLSMLLMMRNGSDGMTGAAKSDRDVDELRSEIARLRAEIEARGMSRSA